MIRDLIYPEDARKVIDSLVKGLEYDAAFSVFGNSFSRTPSASFNQPDFSTGIRFGGKEADDAVRRDASGLCSRFSLISMVSRFECAAHSLLIQRRVLEELKIEGVKMTPLKLWNILQEVEKKD